MWLDQFEFAGFYVAKEKGFYKDIGLDVEIKEFNQNSDITNTVLNKSADFGINSSSLIIDKANGKELVLLGSIFQSAPLVLISLEDSLITNLSDMKNKNIMLANNQKDFATFHFMFKNQGLNLDEMNLIPHTFKIDDLINKKTDVMSAYSTNELFFLEQKGYKTSIIDPKDYGFDFYDDIIFTSKEFADKNPELVKNFYNASIKGWEYAFENIEEVSKLIYEKYNPQNKSLESLVFEANEMKKLVYDKNGKIGTISPEKIDLIINSYKVMGLIKSPIDIDSLIYTKHKEKSFFLNEEEVNYLNNKGPLKICFNPNWLPFEKIDKNEYLGISFEYISLIKEKINANIKIIPSANWNETLENSKNGICDIVPMIIKTEERTDFLDFTSSYISLPMVMAGNMEANFIEDINQLKGKKIGITKGYAFENFLKNKYKDLDFVEFKNMHEGLEEIQKGNIFGFVGNLATIGFAIQKNYIGQIKIISKFEEALQGTIGSRNDEPILNEILEKALQSISETQRQDIYNKWISISYQKELSYVLFSKIIVGFIVFIIILNLIYRQYLLKKMNKELYKRVQIEIEKNEEKNRLSIQQSRMASMGEMLENIAHQWRQPLSIISVSASGMKLKKELGILSEEDIDDSIRHIKTSTEYLSNTIDDFRSFFSKDKIFSTIDIRKTIDKAFDLVSPTFSKSEITVIRDVQSVSFLSFENELIQVLMNILINAKDALDSRESEKLIFVKIKQLNNRISIIIKDNAGGIQKDIIDKIFEPYFTTKHQTQGTGIGLYMSKLIVEKHLDGQIKVKNTSFEFNKKIYHGALFKIILPIKETMES